MRISKVLLSLIAVAGLVVAVGCADEAVRDSGVKKANSAPAPAPAETTTTTTTTTTTESVPASAPK